MREVVLSGRSQSTCTPYLPYLLVGFYSVLSWRFFFLGPTAPALAPLETQPCLDTCSPTDQQAVSSLSWLASLGVRVESGFRPRRSRLRTRLA